MNTTLKSILSILVSSVICLAVVAGAFQLLDVFHLDLLNDPEALAVISVHGIVAGVLCEFAGRWYVRRSKDRLKKRWLYLWRVVYGGFLYLDLIVCLAIGYLHL